jgi:hypothetical protein
MHAQQLQDQLLGGMEARAGRQYVDAHNVIGMSFGRQ